MPDNSRLIMDLTMETEKQKPLATVYHYDVYGKRDEKYDFLTDNSIDSIEWTELENRDPQFFFVPKDFANEESYRVGFCVSDLFVNQACGIVSARDSLLVNITKEEAEAVVSDFGTLEEHDFRRQYRLPNDSRDWTYLSAKNKIPTSIVRTIDYRPFDLRYIPYSPNSKEVLSYPRNEIMKHMISKNNIGLLICKQQSTFDFQHVFLTKTISDKCTLSSQTKEAGYHFPIYLNLDKLDGDMLAGQERTPNLNMEIVNQIAEKIGLTFTNEKEKAESSFAPIDILDYIYAVLHSPTYREKYKEFLKIDFPKIPYPQGIETFRQLVKLGCELRQIHLLESPKVNEFITSYPKGGDNRVTTKIGKKDWELFNLEKKLGRIWINDEQYFDNIPLVAWEFYIGGYQPAQKWLKDRKERTLNYEDVLHYQKIIVALMETNRLMLAIDEIEL